MKALLDGLLPRLFQDCPSSACPTRGSRILTAAFRASFAHGTSPAYGLRLSETTTEPIARAEEQIAAIVQRQEIGTILWFASRARAGSVVSG